MKASESNTDGKSAHIRPSIPRVSEPQVWSTAFGTNGRVQVQFHSNVQFSGNQQSASFNPYNSFAPMNPFGFLGGELFLRMICLLVLMYLCL